MQALTQFIPIQAGQAGFIIQQGLINNLLGKVGYEVRDGYVIFTEDITAAKGVQAVDMQLMVMDFDHYSEFDLLPLPAELAADVVAQVVALLSTAPIQDNAVDSTTEQVQRK